MAKGIEEDVKRGILEKVPPGVPDTWCTRIGITAKKDGSPKAGVRETHHTRSPFNVVRSVPSGKLKMTLDCKDGYHDVSLDHANRHKTTFIAEKGTYRYSRAPQGYGSSNDGYTYRTDKILSKCPGNLELLDYEKIVDETIISFPKPSIISDIKSWFKIVNQVAYSFFKTTIMEPFQDLLKPSTKFEWTVQL